MPLVLGRGLGYHLFMFLILGLLLSLSSDAYASPSFLDKTLAFMRHPCKFLLMGKSVEARLKGFDAPNTKALADFLKIASQLPGRKVAVFDADGTLWAHDIGDVFLKHQHEGQLWPEWVSMPGSQLRISAASLWDIYQTEHTKNETLAYGWLAQWNAGQRETELLGWAKQCFAKFKQNIFNPQKALVNLLHENGFEVWIISASIWWSVIPGAEEFGIPPSRVIATKVKVKNGVLTNELEYPVPYKQGKAGALEQIVGVKPLLVVGNSMGDYEMLLQATHVALTINSHEPGSPYFETETHLQQKVREMQNSPVPWLSQRFRLPKSTK